MIQLTNLIKSYGGRPLFEGVSWRINPGERWGLVGPNGAGKTTLLRILAGEEAADDGEFSKPRGTTIGYLPQETNYQSQATVLDDVCAAIPQAANLESEMRSLEARMEDAKGSDLENLTRRYGEIQDAFLAVDGFSVEAKAQEILSGLGFKQEEMQRPVAELSGGWGMRVYLARLLLAQPDLLLLDEPTNHLDLESLEWIERFLVDYSGAWVAVSHDRYFLNRMVDGIAEVSAEGVELYAGSYDDFIEEREARAELKAKAAANQARRVAELERFVERFRAKATKARQAQSRVKMLQRIERIDAPKRKPRPFRLRLPEPPRAGKTVLTLEEVRKAYPKPARGDQPAGENLVYDSLSLKLPRGERIALVGVNGAGKSTLLKILAGETPIQGGSREIGHNVKLYYFAQHQAETLIPRRSVLEELRSVMPTASESQVRGLLGAFLFSGKEVEKRTAVLSGGEKARVALAKMLARPYNLLLLDEPTNHLDLPSREILESALASYNGTIVFVSHDRYFINRVATTVFEVRTGGEMIQFLGDYDYWQWKLAEEQRAKEQAAQAAEEAARVEAAALQNAQKKKSKGKSRVRQAVLSKNARRKLQQDISSLESQVEESEQRIEELATLLADPEVYADAPRFMALLKDQESAQEQLSALMERWETAASKLSEADKDTES